MGYPFLRVSADSIQFRALHQGDIKLSPLFGRFGEYCGHRMLVVGISAFDPKRTLGSQSARLKSLRNAWSSRRAHAATPVHHTCWLHGHRMAALGARAATCVSADWIAQQPFARCRQLRSSARVSVKQALSRVKTSPSTIAGLTVNTID